MKSVNSHIRRLHRKPYKCNKCDYTNPSEKFVLNHIKMSHNPSSQVDSIQDLNFGSDTFGPRTFGPQQLVPKLVRDHLFRGTKIWGNLLSMGTKLVGTVCPEGQINWGPIVGDQMSGDQMCHSLEFSDPNLSVLIILLTFDYTLKVKSSRLIYKSKGVFNNYVDRILQFLPTLPPCVDKNRHF